MKMVYICSPCRGDYENNIAAAKRYCRRAIIDGVVPIAPHVYFTQFLDDDIGDERKLGMKAAIELLELCHEVWVYGDPTEGMTAEIKYAQYLCKPIILRKT